MEEIKDKFKEEKVQLWLWKETHSLFKIEAIKKNMKLYEFLEYLIEDYIKNNKQMNDTV